MAAATATKKTTEIPDVKIGTIVYWYSGGDTGQQPCPAVVTQINHRSLSLNIMHPNIGNFRSLDGVRYVYDGEAKINEFIEDGGWDLNQDGQKIAELEERVNDLGNRFAALQKQFGEVLRKS